MEHHIFKNGNEKARICECGLGYRNQIHTVTVEEGTKDQQQKTYVTPLEEQRAVVEEGKGSAAGGLRAGQFISTPTSNGIEEVMPEAGWEEEREVESIASNIVYQIGDVLYQALPEDIAHQHFVGARQATNDKAIDFAKKLIKYKLHAVADKAQEEMKCLNNEHHKDLFKAGHTAALSRIEEEVAAKHKDNSSQSDIGKSVYDAYNLALTDIKAIISKIREEI